MLGPCLATNLTLLRRVRGTARFLNGARPPCLFISKTEICFDEDHYRRNHSLGTHCACLFPLFTGRHRARLAWQPFRPRDPLLPALVGFCLNSLETACATTDSFYRLPTTPCLQPLRFQESESLGASTSSSR